MIYRLILAFVLLPFAALAEGLPSRQGDAVVDFSDVLTAAEEAEIRTLLREIRTETDVEIVVVTMDRIANHGGGGKSVAGYTTALFNAWGIGDTSRNDGVMILVATGDRETRIELGSGYASSYDARAQRVIDRSILPNFRERLFADGIIDGVKAVRADIVGPFLGGGAGYLWRTILIGLGIVGGVGGVFFASRAVWNASERCPQCGRASISSWDEVIENATAYSPGSGMRHVSCASCGYADSQQYAISPRNDDDHGSSSGGGWGGGLWSGGSWGESNRDSGRQSSRSLWGGSRSSSRSRSGGGGRSSGGGASGKW
jgi:uncharacterized protein